MFGWTQPWLANIEYKESLKRTSTAAGTGNADVGQKVHYLTNLSLKKEIKLEKVTLVTHLMRNWCNQNSNYGIWIYKLAKQNINGEIELANFLIQIA